MIKTLPTLVLSLAAFTSEASQQPAPVHRWTPVVAKPDVRIELDTATATRTDHQRRVWLRWTFPTPVPDLADVQLERREVDCRRGQTRILSTEDVGGDRKSTRLNSSHTVISYAVFCLKKKRKPSWRNKPLGAQVEGRRTPLVWRERRKVTARRLRA